MSSCPLPDSLSALGANALFRAVVDTTGCLVCLASSDFRYAFFNAECERVTGFSAEEIVGKPIFEVLIPNEQRNSVREVLSKLKPDGYPLLFENDWVAKDGERRTIQWRNTVVANEGEGVHILALGVDVTEQRRTERALRDSETRYRKLTESIPQLVWQVAADGSLQDCNRAYLEYTGLALDDVRGLGWQQAVHPDDLQPVWAVWEKALQAKKPCEFTERVRRYDGEFRWHLVRAVPVLDEEGEIMQWFGTNTDVHEYRLTEERLRERERWLRTLFQAMHEGLTVRDRNGVIVLANPAAERIMGITADQLAGLEPSDPRWKAYTIDRKPLGLDKLPSLRALATGQPQFDSLMGIEHPDGNVFWGNVNAIPVADPDGSVSTVVTTYADVTELIEQRNTIENQKRMLEEANERLRALASTDGLTGLLNHRALQERLTEAYFSARRYKRALSAIMLDVDFFKRYNDAHGHWAGDEVLRIVARTLKQAARTSDIVGRYGGEEFLILLPETDESIARGVAERFRREVMSQTYEHSAVTASLGVASLSSAHRQPSDLLEEADRAMYLAKQSGRNQVMPTVAELSNPATLVSPVSSRP